MGSETLYLLRDRRGITHAFRDNGTNYALCGAAQTLDWSAWTDWHQMEWFNCRVCLARAEGLTTVTPSFRSDKPEVPE